MSQLWKHWRSLIVFALAFQLVENLLFTPAMGLLGRALESRLVLQEVLAGRVRYPFGLFVELDPDIHGLAHISELSNKPVKDVNEIRGYTDAELADYMARYRQKLTDLRASGKDPDLCREMSAMLGAMDAMGLVERGRQARLSSGGVRRAVT